MQLDRTAMTLFVCLFACLPVESFIATRQQSACKGSALVDSRNNSSREQHSFCRKRHISSRRQAELSSSEASFARLDPSEAHTKTLCIRCDHRVAAFMAVADDLDVFSSETYANRCRDKHILRASLLRTKSDFAPRCCCYCCENN